MGYLKALLFVIAYYYREGKMKEGAKKEHIALLEGRIKELREVK